MGVGIRKSFWGIYDASLRALSGGKNQVHLDSVNLPSVMVVIPKMLFADVGLSAPVGAPDNYLPAFRVDSEIVEAVLIGKYQAYGFNSRAYSLPYKDPRVSIDFDDARSYCTAKGTGWHLMSNAEWAAVAHLCSARSFLPRGNNNSLQDIDHAYERGVKATTESDYRTLTGSGPNGWNHDNSPLGIADLNGNVWEWVDGLKISAGIASIATNDGTSTGHPGNTFTAAENDWKSTAVDVTSGMTSGNKITAVRTGANFTGLAVPSTLDGTGSADYGYDGYWFDASSERMPLRGGVWASAGPAGVFALALDYVRSNVNWSIGFRPVLII